MGKGGKNQIRSRPTASKGSREFWLDGAYAILVEAGINAVKVMPMAKAMGVSRTSFYWHFEDREALLEALISRWKQQNTANLVAQTNIFAETITEAVFNLFDCWIDARLFDAKLDFAVRNWAQTSNQLKNSFEEADQERITAIREMFSRFDFPPQQAQTRARTVYYTQMGYIAMMVDEAMTQRLKNMPAYVEIYTGQFPTPTQIARFMARHQNLADSQRNEQLLPE